MEGGDPEVLCLDIKVVCTEAKEMHYFSFTQ